MSSSNDLPLTARPLKGAAGITLKAEFGVNGAGVGAVLKAEFGVKWSGVGAALRAELGVKGWGSTAL